jgi:hypothetical protein
VSAFFRFIAERLRLFFFGASSERAAVERWKAEHRRLRDATARFVNLGFGTAHIRGWESDVRDPNRGTVLVVGLARAEWLLLLETVYGTDHPVTEEHRRRLMGQGG